jgi:phospholipase/carboxylesterase
MRGRLGAAGPAIGAALAITAAACGPQAQIVESGASQLRTIEAGEGPLPFVLIHGYGSSAEEWLPFTRTIDLPAGRRFVIPVGPEATAPPDGPRGGRAWWHLGLASLRRPSDGLPDLSKQAPQGLVESTARIRRLLDELAARGGYARHRQMLAGYSQGAMIAADTAFTTDEPLEALVLLSGTFVNEEVWRAGMARRRGLRVFISHGRRDVILPFDVAERLQQAMRDAGLRVTWMPFDGGHEMTAGVVRELNTFLENFAAEP